MKNNKNSKQEKICNLQQLDFEIRHTTCMGSFEFEIPVLELVFDSSEKDICHIVFTNTSDDFLEPFSTFIARKDKHNLYKINFNTKDGNFVVYKTQRGKKIKYYADKESTFYFRKKCINFMKKKFVILSFEYKSLLADKKRISNISLLNTPDNSIYLYSMSEQFFSFSKYPIDYLRAILTNNTVSDNDLKSLNLEIHEPPSKIAGVEEFFRGLQKRMDTINNINNF